MGSSSGNHPSRAMGRSATKSAVPAIAPGLQAHQTDGARAEGPPQRSGRTEVRTGLVPLFSTARAETRTVFTNEVCSDCRDFFAVPRVLQ